MWDDEPPEYIVKTRPVVRYETAVSMYSAFTTCSPAQAQSLMLSMGPIKPPWQRRRTCECCGAGSQGLSHCLYCRSEIGWEKVNAEAD